MPPEQEASPPGQAAHRSVIEAVREVRQPVWSARPVHDPCLEHACGPAHTPPPGHDALVLAGGRARRLDGVSKPDVLLAGRRLIDRSLDAAARARRVVVVGPAAVAPPGVVATLENPPDGGPVAGIAAGLAALGPGSELVLVLACDVPRAAEAVDALLGALAGDAGARAGHGDRVGHADGAGVGHVDGAVLVDTEGRLQPLVGVYRRASLGAALETLAAAGGVRDAPVRRLLDQLVLVVVPDTGGCAVDVDTWADLARAEGRAHDG